MDIIHDTFPDQQAAIRKRLDQIWDAARMRDFERLESYHLYGPKFTEFKNGKPRGDAHTCAAGERAFFTMIDQPSADMKDLAINVFGAVAIATFNGQYGGVIQGKQVSVAQSTTFVFVQQDNDWKITHEHISMLGVSPLG